MCSLQACAAATANAAHMALLASVACVFAAAVAATTMEMAAEEKARQTRAFIQGAIEKVARMEAMRAFILKSRKERMRAERAAVRAAMTAAAEAARDVQVREGQGDAGRRAGAEGRTERWPGKESR